MSITPMEHSGFEMRRSSELEGGLQRQGSFGSEEEGRSGSEAKIHTQKWSEAEVVRKSDSMVTRLVEK